MSTSTPRRQQQRSVHAVIMDGRRMLGHLGKRDRDTVLELIEGIQDLAQRLYVATLGKSIEQHRTATVAESNVLEELAPAFELTRIDDVDAAETETHGEETTDPHAL